MSLYRPDEEKHFAKILVECCLVLEEDLEIRHDSGSRSQDTEGRRPVSQAL